MSDTSSETPSELWCRRRGEGPAGRFPGPDAWKQGHWHLTQESADAETAEFMSKHPSGSVGDLLWHGPGAPPRTCSFCGGANVDDVIELLKLGWQLHGTDKGYKWYVEPPNPSWHPIPPVKLYSQHFESQEQVDRLNAAAGRTPR